MDNILTVHENILKVLKNEKHMSDCIKSLEEIDNEISNIGDEKDIENDIEKKYIFKNLEEQKKKLMIHKRNLENNYYIEQYICTTKKTIESYHQTNGYVFSITSFTKKDIDDVNKNIKHKYVNEILILSFILKLFNIDINIIYTELIKEEKTIKIKSKPRFYTCAMHLNQLMKQYQCKQNIAIPEELFTHLYDKLKYKKIWNIKNNDIRKSIPKKYNLFYKDTMLIKFEYFKRNKKLFLENNHTIPEPPNIFHLKEKILRRQNKIEIIYNEIMKDSPRKQFFNTPFLLYQLLLQEQYTGLDRNDFKFVYDLKWNNNCFERICKILQRRYPNENWSYTLIN